MFWIFLQYHCSIESMITKASNFLKHCKFQHHLVCLDNGGLSRIKVDYYAGYKTKALGVHINFTCFGVN